jgi:arylsulfatase A-like enzyme
MRVMEGKSGGGFRTRKALLGVLACLTVFFTTGSSGPPALAQEEAQAPARPNIVFVLTDDLDIASVQKMPQISSLLADKGTSFENTFISQSLCCPSRTTILTGLYAHNSGVKGNKPPDGGFQKFRDQGLEEDTIAASLQESGYQTAFFGKYLNGYRGDEEASYVPSGWDEWYGKLDEQELYDYRINENGRVISYGDNNEDFYTDVLAGQAKDFIQRSSSDPKPFFMYVAPTSPHGPATPAERHKGAFANEEAPRPPSFDEEDVSDKPSWIRDTDRFSDEEVSGIDNRYRKRLESMLAVDDMVASLVRELEAAGKLDDTYIFFTSDNGFFQGEHRIKQGKDRPYEESARVPLFVRGPGVPAGSKVEKLALNTDFAPTFAELAGTEFPADGRSLAPLLGGEVPPSWRSSILLEGFFGQTFRAYRAVRTETDKYVEYENGERELYDLSSDPYELQSIHDTAAPTLVEDLKSRLENLKTCAGETCKTAEDGPPAQQQTFQPPRPPVALPYPSSGETPSNKLSSSGGPATNPAYLVQPGDTLSQIAERFGTPMGDIAQANGIEDPNLIFASQMLYVPVRSAP